MERMTGTELARRMEMTVEELASEWALGPNDTAVVWPDGSVTATQADGTGLGQVAPAGSVPQPPCRSCGSYAPDASRADGLCAGCGDSVDAGLPVAAAYGEAAR